MRHSTNFADFKFQFYSREIAAFVVVVVVVVFVVVVAKFDFHGMHPEFCEIISTVSLRRQ